MDEALVAENSWIEVLDANKNEHYYFNYATSENTWKIPEEYSNWKNNEIDSYLKRTQSSWTRHYDASRGKPYYYQKSSKSTQWKPPDEVDACIEWLTKLTKKRNKKRKKTENEVTTKDIIQEKKVDQDDVRKVDRKRELDETTEEKGKRKKDSVKEQVISKIDEELKVSQGDEEELHDFDAYDNFNGYAEPEVVREEEGTPVHQLDDFAYDWESSPSNIVSSGYSTFPFGSTQGASSSLPSSIIQSTSEVPIAIVKEHLEEEVVESEVDKKKRRLQELELAFSQTDAVMETAVRDLIMTYVRTASECDADTSVNAYMKVVDLLSQSYRGYAQMTCITASWLQRIADLKKTTTVVIHPHSYNTSATSSSSQLLSIATMENIENNIYNVISRYIQSYFSSQQADVLLTQSNHKPKYLLDMISDPIWRQLLIQLFNNHKESSLLGYCIRKISSAGFYRDFAHVVKGADYYDVFSDIVTDQLACIAICTIDEYANIMNELVRICISSENTYLYIQYLLSLMISQLQSSTTTEAEDTSSASFIDQGYALRLGRLAHDVENGAIWDRYSMNVSTEESSSLVLDSKSVNILKLSQVWPNSITNQESTVPLTTELFKIMKDNCVYQVMVERLCVLYFGVQGKADAVSLFSEHIVRSIQQPIELLRHHKIIELLVDALVHPRRQIPAPNYRTCLLLSLISLYQPNPTSEQITNIITTAEKLMKLRQLLGDIYKLASISKSFDEAIEILQLLSLHSIHACCVARWLLCSFHDSSFYNRSSFLTLLPSLLQFIVTIINLYPFLHEDCANILKAAILIPSDEVTDKMGYTNNQKSIMDCFVYLICSGYAFAPLNFMVNKMSSFDTGSVRHFLMHFLRSIKPPFSKSFLLKVVELLNIDSVRSAVSSKYFLEEGMPILDEFISLVEASEHAHVLEAIVLLQK